MTKLRVGLLVNSRRVPAWAYRMLERIATSDYADIVLVVENDLSKLKEAPDRSAAHVTHRLVRRPLLVAQNKMMNPRRPKPAAFAPMSIDELLPDVPSLVVEPRRKKVSDYIRKDDLATIREAELDVMIRLGFRILRGGILRAARYGVWSYHHGDNHVNRGGPAAYWEAMESWGLTGTILQVLTEDLDNGQVLARTWSSTTDVSIHQNKNRIYWKALSLLPRKLEELHRDGPDAFFARVDAENARPTLYANRLYRRPSNRELAGHLGRKAAARVRGKIRERLFFDQWFLLFSLGTSMSTSFWRFKPIVPPKHRFWADPHIVRRNGTYYIFIEDAVYSPRKFGHIAVIEMDAKGRWTPPSPVLERPYHLSYPFIFEFEGVTYMIPETMENRSIELYRCEEFPHRWTFVKTLMNDVSAVDATLVHHDDRWWMFANMIENEGASSWDELFLFHAESPLSDDWTPHPRSPVVSDASAARPAGRIFEHNGRLIRPSQNCDGGYGAGFNLAEIRVLNRAEYEEDVYCRVRPNWEPGLTGTHTFAYCEGLTIIDGKRRRRR